jgi:3-oxoacyl-[acyl-carrier protein] reductase
MARFTGRTAIVTGAAQGIGAVYAEALAAEGANVVVADLNAERGAQVAAQIVADGGNAVFRRVDVSDPASATELAESTVAEFGAIDQLVNNAAIYGDMKLDLLLTVPWDYYKKFMSVNLDGALNVTRAVWKPMIAAGGGSIVNQSSTAAWLYSGFYGLAKVGINGLTQQLAFELGGSNIRVNAIAPGPIDTEATQTVTPANIVKDLVSRIPIKRMGTPQDLVGACLYLLSDDAGWVTGHILNVDGGQIFRS